MVMNHQGYSAYPSKDEVRRMREAMHDIKLPYDWNAPLPDHGILPEDHANAFADRLLDQETHQTLTPIMRSIIKRSFLAGWSASLDSQDRRNAEQTITPLTPTGVEQLVAAVTPLISKIVQDSLRMAGVVQPMTQPIPGTSKLPEGWAYITHNRGSYPCHKPAFILTRKITEGEFVDPTVFRYLSGMPIPTDARSTCGSCLQEVHPYSNADLDWTPHIISNANRTLSGHFIEPDNPPRAAVSPDASQAGDYGFPSVPDPRFDVAEPGDIPNPQAPGELSDLEMQEIFKLKAEADRALNNDPWSLQSEGGSNGRSTVSGS